MPSKQAPGIWAVGSASNVGSHAAGGVRDTPEPAPEPEPPHYEPAAAQVPHYAAAVSASAAYEPVESSSNGWGDSAELVPAGAAVRFSLGKRMPVATRSTFNDSGPCISG